MPVKAHESDRAGQLQHSQAILQRDVNEDVTGEQRQF
jgi:hypothetical protein